MQFNYDEYVKESLPFEKIIKKYLSPSQDMTIFEIGSCEGEDTIRMKRLFPKATIYTFEPLEDNVKKIQKNFKRYGLSADHVFKLALSDQAGTSVFHVSSGHPDHMPKTEWDFGNKSSSLLPPKEHLKTHEWMNFDKKIQVKTDRLDSFCKEQQVDHIDFIYMDVQGAELMVLEGAGAMTDHISVIWLEVEAIELYSDQPLKTDVERFMAAHDFIKVMDTVDDVSGDQLYVKKALYNERRGPLHHLKKLGRRS